MAMGFKPTGIALVELCSYCGAVDGFLQQGAELLESTVSIRDTEVEELVSNISRMTAEYAKSGRTAQEICMGFNGGTLLIVWGDVGGVTLRFQGKIDRIEKAIAECRSFLKQILNDKPPEPEPEAEPEPSPEVSQPDAAWSRYEPLLTNLLTSVVSRSTAGTIIRRVIDSLALGESVPDASLEKITRLVLEKVPDRRKREALAAEARDNLEKSLNL